MKELEVKIPCSVTHETIMEVANTNPDLFRNEDLSINYGKVLFALGFFINTNMYNKGIYINKDVYVRNNAKPSMVYKTDVYNGNVRLKVKCLDRHGQVKYSKELHELAPVYEKLEVIQPTDIYGYIKKFENVLSIGDLDHYNDGMAAMLQPNENKRNIVRNPR